MEQHQSHDLIVVLGHPAGLGRTDTAKIGQQHRHNAGTVEIVALISVKVIQFKVILIAGDHGFQLLTGSLEVHKRIDRRAGTRRHMRPEEVGCRIASRGMDQSVNPLHVFAGGANWPCELRYAVVINVAAAVKGIGAVDGTENQRGTKAMLRIDALNYGKAHHAFQTTLWRL